MLPDATLDQRIATGFHRNTMLNEEGGIDPLEFRFYAMVDRITTTATVWLGLTLGCAQCHTHKFDPIPHREYYRLMAFLNNADEPTIDVPQADVAAKRAEIERQDRETRSRLAEPLSARKRSSDWLNAEPDEVRVSGGATAEKLDDGSVRFSGTSPDTDSYTLSFETDAASLSALRLEALADPQLPSKGPGRTPHGNFVVTEVSVSAAPKDKPRPGASRSSSPAPKPISPRTAFRPSTRSTASRRPAGRFTARASGTSTARDASFRQALGDRRTSDLDSQDRPAVRQAAHARPVAAQSRLSKRRSKTTGREDVQPPRASRRRSSPPGSTAKSKQAAKWTLLKPLAAKSNVPTLTIEGRRFGLRQRRHDQARHLRPDLDLAGLAGITAIRLEGLPDDRLPKDGPGRIYYEGPFGDFFLSKLTVTPQRTRQRGASQTAEARRHRSSSNPPANRSPMATTRPPWRSTTIRRPAGRSTAARADRTGPRSYSTGRCRAADQLRLQLLFERYYAAGLGRFRIWATTDPHVAATRDLPIDIEDLLAPAGRATFARSSASGC